MGAGFARLVQGQKQAWEQWVEFWPELHFHAPPASPGSRGLWPRSHCLEEGPSDVEAWGIQEWGATRSSSPQHQLVSAGVGTLPILVDPWAQK